MTIDYRKAFPNREYAFKDVRFQMGPKKGAFILIRDAGKPEQTSKMMNSIVVLPQTSKYLFYSDQVLNPLNLKTVLNRKARNEFFKAINASDDLEALLVRITQFPDAANTKWSDNRPVFVDLTGDLERVYPYVLDQKRTPLARNSYYDLVLRKILKNYNFPNRENVVFVRIPDVSSPGNLIEAIRSVMRRSFELVANMFADATLIIVDPVRGKFMIPDLTEKGKTTSPAALERFMKANAAAAGRTVAEVDAEIPENTKDAPTPAVTVDEEADVDAPDIGDIIGMATAVEESQNEAEARKFIQEKSESQEKALSEFLAALPKLSVDDRYLGIKEETVMNGNMKKAETFRVTSGYYRNFFHRDLAAIAKSLNSDLENPVVVRSIKLEPANTPLDLKEELTIEFEDPKGKRHKFVVDVPKLSHDGFMLINGNRKFIAKQLTQLPVIKEAPDRVQITTNYNKVFLYRKGDKTGPTEERILKTLVGKSYKGVKIINGNSYSGNIGYEVDVPYNYVAKRINSVSFSSGSEKVSTDFYFSQKAIRGILKDAGLQIPEHRIPLALKRGAGGVITDVLLEDTSNRSCAWFSVKLRSEDTRRYRDVFECLIQVMQNHAADPKIYKAFNEASGGKSFSYTDVRILASSIPLGILLAFYLGLPEALNRIGVKYTIEKENRRPTENEKVVKFNDASFYIDCGGDTSKELVVNGLYFLPSREYSVADAETRGTVYLEFFGSATGSRNTAKGLLNFLPAMIDPITLGILKELKLPTNFPDLLVYGNNLLGNFTHRRKNDMANFRLRDSEVIAVGVYKALINSFKEYKRTFRTGVVQPISAPKNAVIKNIQSMPNVEDFSVLSPFLEMELRAKTTFKGPSGLKNLFSPL